MKSDCDRRKFLKLSSAFAVSAAFVQHNENAEAGLSSPGSSKLRKAACIGVMPDEYSVLEKFQKAKSLGFEGIEPNTLTSPEEVSEYMEASQKTGVKIHSIMNSGHWRYPLTDDDPQVVKACVQGIKTSMQNAHALGADSILLVPGIVTSQVGYGEVYKRSQEQVRKLIPLAKDLDVIIAIENVGNRFLLSPLEFARYIDEFESPCVRAYFDVGNVTSIGFPPDWIRILGRRLYKVHIKKFEPGRRLPKFDPADRRTQGIDWPDVRRALDEVGYEGWVTAEVRSGSEAYLQELSSRINQIFEGVDPVSD
jgi:hexulose-6-phosphate isomerase